MIKIVASDYDGTLIQDGRISSDTVEMIRKFQAQGHLFGVVTGRDYVIGFQLFKQENAFPFDFIISHNGAVAYDREGKVLFTQSVNGDLKWHETTLVQRLVEMCLKMTGNHCGIAFEKSRLKFHPDSLKGMDVDASIYSPLSALQNVRDFNMANARCDTEKHAAQVVEALKKEFGDLLNLSQNGRYIDISSGGVDKSTGIARYAEIMHVSLDNIWTAGDNYNDVPMLQKYHGCAMSSGVESAAQAAEYVCDSVGDVIKIALNHQCEIKS